jgi:hypothetical protein
VDTYRLVMSAFLGLCQVVAIGVLIRVNWRAANGRLPRNQSTGLRTAATMRSDKAWVAGHRAALRLTPLYLLTIAGTITALLVAVLLPASLSVTLVVGVGGLFALVPLAVYSAVVANKAAKSAGDQPDDRQQ